MLCDGDEAGSLDISHITLIVYGIAVVVALAGILATALTTRRRRRWMVTRSARPQDYDFEALFKNESRDGSSPSSSHYHHYYPFFNYYTFLLPLARFLVISLLLVAATAVGCSGYFYYYHSSGESEASEVRERRAWYTQIEFCIHYGPGEAKGGALCRDLGLYYVLVAAFSLVAYIAFTSITVPFLLAAGALPEEAPPVLAMTIKGAAPAEFGPQPSATTNEVDQEQHHAGSISLIRQRDAPTSPYYYPFPYISRDGKGQGQTIICEHNQVRRLVRLHYWCPVGRSALRGLYYLLVSLYVFVLALESWRFGVMTWYGNPYYGGGGGHQHGASMLWLVRYGCHIAMLVFMSTLLALFFQPRWLFITDATMLLWERFPSAKGKGIVSGLHRLRRWFCSAIQRGKENNAEESDEESAQDKNSGKRGSWPRDLLPTLCQSIPIDYELLSDVAFTHLFSDDDQKTADDCLRKGEPDTFTREPRTNRPASFIIGTVFFRYRHALAVLAVVRVVQEALALLPALLLRALVDRLEGRSSDRDDPRRSKTTIIRESLVIVIIFIIINLLSSLMRTQYDIKMKKLALKIRGALAGVLYHRAAAMGDAYFRASSGHAGGDKGARDRAGRGCSIDTLDGCQHPPADRSEEAPAADGARAQPDDTGTAANSEVNHADAAVLNYLLVDIPRVSEQVENINNIWCLPLQTVLALCLLYLQLSWAFVAGLALALALIPVNMVLAKTISSVNTRMMTSNDARLGVIQESLQKIVVVKMCGWAPAVLSWISRPRLAYFSSLSFIKYLDACCVFFWATTPILVSLSSFALYSSFRSASNSEGSIDEDGPFPPLTPGRVIASLALFQTLILPLNSYPWVITGMVEAYVSAKRLSRYLSGFDIFSSRHGRRGPPGCGETANSQDSSEDSTDKQTKTQSKEEYNGNRGDNKAGHCGPGLSAPAPLLFVPPGTRFIAGSQTVTVGPDGLRVGNSRAEGATTPSEGAGGPHSNIILITGRPGSGKSLLLRGLLGDVACHPPFRDAGAADADGDGTPLGAFRWRHYLPQVPLLLTGATIRENILFHRHRAPAQALQQALSQLLPSLTHPSLSGADTPHFSYQLQCRVQQLLLPMTKAYRPALHDSALLQDIVPTICSPQEGGTNINEEPSSDAATKDNSAPAAGSAGDLKLIGNEGCNLSGGQRCRVALARAIYQIYYNYYEERTSHEAAAAWGTGAVRSTSSSAAQFLLMDDLLGSLDAVVSARVVRGLAALLDLNRGIEHSGPTERREGGPVVGLGGSQLCIIAVGDHPDLLHLAAKQWRLSPSCSGPEDAGSHPADRFNSNIYAISNGTLSLVPDQDPLVQDLIHRLRSEGHKPDGNNSGAAKNERDHHGDLEQALGVSAFKLASTIEQRCRQLDREQSSISDLNPNSHDDHLRSNDNENNINNRTVAELAPNIFLPELAPMPYIYPKSYYYYSKGVGDSEAASPQGANEAQKDMGAAPADSVLSSCGYFPTCSSWLKFIERTTCIGGDPSALNVDQAGINPVTAGEAFFQEGNADISSGAKAKEGSKDESKATNDKDEEGENDEDGEVALSGSVLKHLSMYIRAMGIDFFAAILVFVLFMQAARNYSDYYVTYWATEHGASEKPDTHEANSTDGNTSGSTEAIKTFISTLGYIALFNIAFVFFRSVLFAYSCLRAAQWLHQLVVKSLFLAHYNFFLRTPIFRLLNCLGKDTTVIDDSLPFMFNILLAQGALLLGALVMVAITSQSLMTVLLAMGPITALLFFLQRPYRRVSRDLKRIEAAARTPLVHQLMALLAGSPVMHGLDTSRHPPPGEGPKPESRAIVTFIRRSFEQGFNTWQRVGFNLALVQAWFNLVIQMIGLGLMAIASVLSLVVYYQNDSNSNSNNNSNEGNSDSSSQAVAAAGVGLAMSYITPLTQYINNFLGTLAELEKQLVSVERISRYCQQDKDDHCIKDSQLPRNQVPRAPERDGASFERTATSFIIRSCPHARGGVGSGRAEKLPAGFRAAQPFEMLESIEKAPLLNVISILNSFDNNRAYHMKNKEVKSKHCITFEGSHCANVEREKDKSSINADLSEEHVTNDITENKVQGRAKKNISIERFSQYVLSLGSLERFWYQTVLGWSGRFGCQYPSDVAAAADLHAGHSREQNDNRIFVIKNLNIVYTGDEHSLWQERSSGSAQVPVASAAPTTQVLFDINLTINYGERLAIVGRTGSGKSTLLRALLGLVTMTQAETRTTGPIREGEYLAGSARPKSRPERNQRAGGPLVINEEGHAKSRHEDDATPLLGPRHDGGQPHRPMGAGLETRATLVPVGYGDIWVHGVPLQLLQPDWYRRHITVLPQEGAVWAGTIRQNIALFDDEGSDDEGEGSYTLPSISSSRCRSYRDFVMMLLLEWFQLSHRFALDAVVHPGGGNLSAGERHLLSLIRLLFYCFDPEKGRLWWRRQRATNGKPGDLERGPCTAAAGAHAASILGVLRSAPKTCRSKVMLIDEPAVVLDAATETLLWQLLLSTFPDSTIVAITHKLDILARGLASPKSSDLLREPKERGTTVHRVGAPFFTRAVVLDAGRVIADDTPSRLVVLGVGPFKAISASIGSPSEHGTPDLQAST